MFAGGAGARSEGTRDGVRVWLLGGCSGRWSTRIDVMMDREASGADCLVIGGGLSGLACARQLAEAGYTVQVLEAESSVGGRARSSLYQGEPVDRGFQTLFRGYAETGTFLEAIGIGAGQLRAFERGVVAYDGVRWRRVGLSASSLMGQHAMSHSDIRKLAALGGKAAAGSVRRLLDEDDEETTAEGLSARGLSESIRSELLRPLLGGMLLDRSLSADFGYVKFLMAMMVRGPAMLPVDGMGVIAQRAEAAITNAGGMVWTGVRAARLDVGGDRRVRGVVLQDGRSVSARNVVIALDSDNARALLAEHDPASARRLPSEPAGVISAAFALDQPLYSGRTVLLDAASPDGDNRVDLFCQTTNVTRPGSPGPHIVIAQSATQGWRHVDPDRYIQAVNERMAKWAPAFPWQRIAKPIETFTHAWAQYIPRPGVRRDLPGPRTALTNVILAGDAVMHPSIEGAVSSGHRAARVVHEILR